MMEILYSQKCIWGISSVSTLIYWRTATVAAEKINCRIDIQAGSMIITCLKSAGDAPCMFSLLENQNSGESKRLDFRLVCTFEINVIISAENSIGGKSVT